MNKNVTILVGKSGSGKDHILNALVSKYGFNPLTSHTTRPKRPNEKEGLEYNFILEEDFLQMIRENKFIEYRTYDTLVNNIPEKWFYGLSKQELDYSKHHVVILDIQGARDFIRWHGAEKCNVLFINCASDIRRSRAKARGGYDETEFNRRLEDDRDKFDIVKYYEIIDTVIENNGTLEELDSKVKKYVSKFYKE